MSPELPRGGTDEGGRTDPEGQQWAIQRRIEDVFSKLGEKYGDFTGRVEVRIHPEVTFEDIGGLTEAKAAIRGLAGSCRSDSRAQLGPYRSWTRGIENRA